jgi:hypothetical protein
MKSSGSPEEVRPPIVTHLTRVKLSLEPDIDSLAEAASGKSLITAAMVDQAGRQVADRYTRVIAMMELLAVHGFIFRTREKAVFCYSSEVEAGVAKRLLLSAGFRDREFQIHLEYDRGWGML